MIRFIAMPLLAAVSLSACTWVKPTTRSQAIAYVPAEAAASCQKLGTVSVETLNKVALMSRDPVTIKNELITLAKNEAVILKGDTISDLTPIKDGKQDFTVARCR